MTDTALSARQVQALAEFWDTWRVNRNNPLAESMVSRTVSAGTHAGRHAFGYVGAVLDEAGWTTDIPMLVDLEASRATREGLSGCPEAGSKAYAEVLHGFAEAVRAIK